MEFEIMDHFEKRICELHGANPSIARHLFKLWGIDALESKAEVESLLSSQLLLKKLYPLPGVSMLSQFSSNELSSKGLTLTALESSPHEFKDAKFGYRWRQLYHGFAEEWLDLYMLNEPALQVSLNDVAAEIVRSLKNRD